MSEARARLLFIDDEERILRSLKMMFKHDYEVHTTTDPFAAIELVGNTRVDVVVSDQRMPIMEGVDVLRQVRERSPGTVRLLLTGYSDMDAMVRSVNEGEIFRYIEKPWQSQQLIDTIREAVHAAAGAEAANAPAPAQDIEALPVSTAGREVLVLDDDPATAQLITELLGKEVQVHHATTIESAFERLSSNAIDVLVSDVVLSGEDVTDAIKELKLAAPDIQTIVVASFQDRNLLYGLINEGRISRYLPKPLSSKLLLRAMHSVLERAKDIRTKPELLATEAPSASAASTHRPIRQRIMGFLGRLRK